MLSYGQPAPYWNDYQLDPRENAMVGPVTGFIVEYESPTEVPEPSAAAFLLAGLGLLLVGRQEHREYKGTGQLSGVTVGAGEVSEFCGTDNS